MSLLVPLRTFLAAYRLGSLSAAARELAITQSSASDHLKALEAAHGKPLLVRAARGVTPTEAGHDLALASGEAMDVIERSLAALRARGAPLGGIVTLAGPGEYLGEQVLPRLAGLQDRGVRLRLMVGNREAIYARLASGEADLAVTASQPTDRALDFTRIGTERFVLVASPMLAALIGKPDPTRLSAHACLAYDEERPLIRDLFRHAYNATPSAVPAVIAPDLRILLRLALAGRGWTVLPDYLCALPIAEGKLVTLLAPDAGPSNALNLVWRRSALREQRVALARDLLLQSPAG
jgi:DNA-binding transcriptional LysR family regulator